MARLIDRLPSAPKIRQKKLIVLSRSRVGTFSLYQALKVLGYKPYHMFEVLKRDVMHMRLFEEALRCKYLGAGQPYGKAEFDKWLAEYDAIVEIPQFFVDEFTAFYPDAKFIFTYRDINSWEQSVNNTIAVVLHDCKSFPLNTVRLIDTWIDAFCTLHDAIEQVAFHGKGTKCGMGDAKRDGLKLEEKVKRLSPKMNMLVSRLETGFGWEQICPFLGVNIPNTPYPKGNAPEEFKRLGQEKLGPRIMKATLIGCSIIVAPILGIVIAIVLR